MGFFSVFRKKANSNDIELIPLVYDNTSSKIVIDTPGIVPISSGNVIDTTSMDNIAKHIHNTEYLRSLAKETGNIGPLVTIRNDDILPSDFVWRENSSNTYGELRLSKFGIELKNYIVNNSIHKENTPFLIPVSEEEKKRELSKFDKDFGKIYSGTKFRTTKHFTLNTPLGFTGSYNFVKSDRKYTIIDDATLLLNSPYTYTISGRDSYLDVTHEGLPISDSAIILISEDYFNEIKNDTSLLNKLLERNLMVYRGDLDMAINMIMSERGILPFRPGARMEYDDELEDIIASNLQSICNSHGYRYEIGHGNLFGQGGHFTDLIDTDANMVDTSLLSFIDFLNLNLNLDYEITLSMINDSNSLFKIFRDIGVDRIIELINYYNSYMKSSIDSSFSDYSVDRNNLPEDISNLFSSTVRRIDNYFINNDPKEDMEFWDMVMAFYTKSTVQEQIIYANMINERLNNLERM